MDSNSPGDVRLDAAHSLYRLYDRRVSRQDHVESLREELDHALTLVLSEDRAAPNAPYLVRSVRRDARRILRRRNAARPEHTAFESGDELIAGQPSYVANWPSGVRFPNPEELLLAGERAEQLNRITRQLGSDAAACADGLLKGESVSESAARAQISPRRVRYLRCVIRTRVAADVREDAA